MSNYHRQSGWYTQKMKREQVTHIVNCRRIGDGGRLVRKGSHPAVGPTSLLTSVTRTDSGKHDELREFIDHSSHKKFQCGAVHRMRTNPTPGRERLRAEIELSWTARTSSRTPSPGCANRSAVVAVLMHTHIELCANGLSNEGECGRRCRVKLGAN